MSYKAWILAFIVFLPVVASTQVVKFMGRYDVSQVDIVNDSTWTLTGVFVDNTGSYTGLDADTNDKIIQRGFSGASKLVFDRYKIVGIITQDANNLVVNVRSDFSTGVLNVTGMPLTGAFPIATALTDTSTLTLRTSFYINGIDPDYDAALDNLNLRETFAGTGIDNIWQRDGEQVTLINNTDSVGIGTQTPTTDLTIQGNVNYVPVILDSAMIDQTGITAAQLSRIMIYNDINSAWYDWTYDGDALFDYGQEGQLVTLFSMNTGVLYLRNNDTTNTVVFDMSGGDNITCKFVDNTWVEVGRVDFAPYSSCASRGGGSGGGSVTYVGATGGTGISVTGSPITGAGTLVITNTAPDKTHTLTPGTGISISGHHPGPWTITNTLPSLGGTVYSVSGIWPITVTNPTTTPIVAINQASSTDSGYITQTDWNTFNNKLSSTLTSANLFVGNSSNVATARSLSGDATISNTGVMTLSRNAVDSTNIQNNNVGGDKLYLAGNVQGDVMYFNGIDWVRLPAGTSGKFLRTNGASANPSWETASTTVGTVTEFSFTNANGFTGTVNNPTTTPALTIDLQNSAADGVTKGKATFTATDFNNNIVGGQSGGIISIDYTNGQKATASVPGFLTAADWTTFNSKIGGSGTINYIPKYTATGTLGDSKIYQTPGAFGRTYINMNITGTASDFLSIDGYGNTHYVFGPLNTVVASHNYANFSVNSSTGDLTIRATEAGSVENDVYIQPIGGYIYAGILNGMLKGVSGKLTVATPGTDYLTTDKYWYVDSEGTYDFSIRATPNAVGGKYLSKVRINTDAQIDSTLTLTNVALKSTTPTYGLVMDGDVVKKYAWPTTVAGSNVTAGSNKISLGGTPTGAALQAFSVDVDETKINHDNLLNYTARRHFTQPTIDTVNPANAGILKADVNGVLSAATAGTDYLTTDKYWYVNAEGTYDYSIKAKPNAVTSKYLTEVRIATDVRIDSTLTLDNVATKSTTPTYALVMDGTTVKKFAWPESSTFVDPSTTRGDLITRGGTDNLKRLPRGSAGQVLKVRGDTLYWATDETGAGGTLTWADTLAQLATDYDLDTLSFLRAEVDPVWISDSTDFLSKYDTAINKVETRYHADATYEPKITAGTTGQYWRGDKTWQTLPTMASVSAGTGAITVTGTPPAYVVNNTDPDQSTTNELQNITYTNRAINISGGTGALIPRFSTSDTVSGLVMGSSNKDGSYFLNATGDWTIPAGTGTGEANTASNIGSGVGVYASKSGVDLRFKSLNDGIAISIDSNSTDITINADTTTILETKAMSMSRDSVLQGKWDTIHQVRTWKYDSAGTILVGSGDNTYDALKVGALNTVLTSNGYGVAPEWREPTGGGSSHSALTVSNPGQGLSLNVANQILTSTVASATDTGMITKEDWVKHELGWAQRLALASGVPPLSLSLGSNVLVGEMTQASTNTNGWLSSANWNTFNQKQNQLYFKDIKKVDNKLTFSGDSVGIIASTVPDPTNLTIGIDETKINHNNLLNYATNRHFLQTEIQNVYTGYTGLLKATAGSLSTITDNHSQWDTAYSRRITVTNATSPLVMSISSNTLNGSIVQANTDNSGYLTYQDWRTFNGKQDLIAPGTTLQYWRGDKTWATLPVVDTLPIDSTYVVSGTNVIVDSAFGAKGKVYTINAVQPTNYWTANGNDIYPNNTGNIGIGVTNPSKKFEVKGQAKLDSAVYLSGLTQGSSGDSIVLWNPSTKQLYWGSRSTSVGFADPMTTRGDIIVRNASNVTARLGLGSNGYVLRSNGSDVVWDTLSAGHTAVSIDVIGSTPNNKGMTLSDQKLNLEPASASYGGVVTTGTQTFAGSKTFNAATTFLNTLSTQKVGAASSYDSIYVRDVSTGLFKAYPKPSAGYNISLAGNKIGVSKPWRTQDSLSINLSPNPTGLVKSTVGKLTTITDNSSKWNSDVSGARNIGTGAAVYVSDSSHYLLFRRINSADMNLTVTENARDITIKNESPDRVITLTPLGIVSIGGTYPNFTIGATEADGSTSNEGSLTVSAGTSTTSLVNSNTSGSSPVVLEAGAGIVLSENVGSNKITITNSNATNYWQKNGNLLAPSTITDSVGIGTAAPTAKLDVDGDIKAATTDDGIAVYGTSGVGGYGIKGYNSASGYGVGGESSSGTGTLGLSTSGTGVYGVTSGLSGNGVYAQNLASGGNALRVSGNIKIDSLPPSTTKQSMMMWDSATGKVWYRNYPSSVVTSVGLSMPSIFNVSGSPVTSSGTLAVTSVAQSASMVYSGPATGSPATPTFRSLGINELSDVDTSGRTVGQGLGWDGSAWVPTTFAIGGSTSGGQNNVGKNIGTGVGVYSGKSDTTLNFRSLNGIGGVTTALNGSTVEISLTDTTKWVRLADSNDAEYRHYLTPYMASVSYEYKIATDNDTTKFWRGDKTWATVPIYNDSTCVKGTANKIRVDSSGNTYTITNITLDSTYIRSGTGVTIDSSGNTYTINRVTPSLNQVMAVDSATTHEYIGYNKITSVVQTNVAGMTVYNNNYTPAFLGFRGNGAVKTNNQLFGLFGSGHNGVSSGVYDYTYIDGVKADSSLGYFSGSRMVGVVGIADQDWDWGKYGTSLVFKTTTNNDSIVTERMRVTNDGSVGIGTTTPDSLLTVDGGIKGDNLQLLENAVINGTIKIAGGSPGAGKFLMSDAVGNATWATTTGAVYKGEVNGSNGTPKIGGAALKDGTGTLGWYYACYNTGTWDYGNPSGNIITLTVGDQIYYNGTQWLRIPGAGSYTLPTATASILGGVKVGNSLNILSDILDVKNGDKGDLTVSNSGTVWTLDRVNENDGEWNTVTVNNKGLVVSAKNTDYLDPSDSTTTAWVKGTENVYLRDENDNVGIGTDNPREKVDVVGNIQTTGDIKLGGNISIDSDSLTIERNTATPNQAAHYLNVKMPPYAVGGNTAASISCQIVKKDTATGGTGFVFSEAQTALNVKTGTAQIQVSRPGIAAPLTFFSAQYSGSVKTTQLPQVPTATTGASIATIESDGTVNKISGTNGYSMRYISGNWRAWPDSTGTGNYWTRASGKIYPTTATDDIVANDSLRVEGNAYVKGFMNVKYGITQESDAVSSWYGLKNYRYGQQLSNTGTTSLPVGAWGSGTIVTSEGATYASFRFASDGTVTLLSDCTSDVANTYTGGKLCIYDAGTTVTIANFLGSTKYLLIDIKYTTASDD